MSLFMLFKTSFFIPLPAPRHQQLGEPSALKPELGGREEVPSLPFLALRIPHCMWLVHFLLPRSSVREAAQRRGRWEKSNLMWLLLLQASVDILFGQIPKHCLFHSQGVCPSPCSFSHPFSQF